MASADDKNRTVAMTPDPGATVRASRLPDPALPPDPDATALASAAPTRAVPRADALPTIELDARETCRTPAAEARRDAAPEADGIDAMDDPYFSPAAPEDLTTAHSFVTIQSPVESLPERKARLPIWGVVLIVIVLLAGVGAVASLTYEQELWGGKTVPEVLGMSEEEAADALAELGFAVEVEYRSVDEGFGLVLSCSPAPGLRVDPAEGATLTVAAERVVPEVVGMTADEASAALHAAGAVDVTLTYQSSEEPEGTVLVVTPGEGEPFTSTTPVTLTLARAFAVPDVEGLPVDEARSALEAEGLVCSVTYVESTAQKNLVVTTDPAPGTVVERGATITLNVSSPYPSSQAKLLEYFEASPQELASYLSEEGFTLRYGAIHAASGNARVAYESASGNVVQISDEPESGAYEGESTADVLAGGAGIGGVRYAFSAASVPSGGTSESLEGVRAVMGACGLSGLVDACDQDSIVLPEEAAAQDDLHFICAYGVQDGYTWAILIGGHEGSTSVVALAAPSGHFSDVDLSGFGGSVCNYVAGVNLYAR